jgi:hypothetical protein
VPPGVDLSCYDCKFEFRMSNQTGQEAGVRAMQTAPCTPAQHAFGCLVPGRPVAYSDSFQQVEAAKWSIDIENSQQIRDVAVFMTQPLNMPGMGMSCYITGPCLPRCRSLRLWSHPLRSRVSVVLTLERACRRHAIGKCAGPPFAEWHFIGAITNESPSGVFRVRWPQNEAAPTAARLGISIEPLQQIESQQATLPSTELVDFGKFVAKDLWNYLESFEVMHQHGQFLLSLFDKWMKRFEDR